MTDDTAPRAAGRDAPRASPVPLSFAGHPDAETLRDELSSIACWHDDLWLGSDEGATLERLSPDGRGGYGAHASFPLTGLLDLPDAEAEVDIEGIDAVDGWLWIVGSHAARRSGPDDESDVEGSLRRLARVRRRGNRYLLARIPLARSAEDGRWRPVREASDADAPRVAARLKGGRRHDALTAALRGDEHLAPFLRIPGKDNGFDVEGLVVAEDRVLLGLRGPVLRGWAVVLAVRPEPRDGRPDRLRLGRIGPRGERYEKHFLDLRGLGVRDLCRDGDDVLILAGPTMVLDGRAAVFRWRGAARAGGGGHALVPRARLEHVLELPYGVGEDEGVEHPEGIALLPRTDGRSGLLVVHDAPQPRRRIGADGVTADLYDLG